MSERKILYTEPESYFTEEALAILKAEWEKDEELSKKEKDSKKESEDKKDGNK